METTLWMGFALDPGKKKTAGRAADGPMGPSAITFSAYFTPAVAATSAAKSVSAFSMPSPSA